MVRLLFALFLVIAIVAAVMWIVATIGVARARLSDTARVGWVLLAMVPIIGPILWWTVGRPAAAVDR